MTAQLALFPNGARCVDGMVVGLEVPPARSHRRDPKSSHLAAKAQTDSGRQHAHIEIVLELLRRAPASTYRELHAGQEGPNFLEPAEVQRRLQDCGMTGLAQRGAIRVCRLSGRPAQTWSLINDTNRGIAE